MSISLYSEALGAGTPSSQTFEKTQFIPSLNHGPPYIDGSDIVHYNESYPWIVGCAFDQVPPVDIQPVRISASVIEGNKKPMFYVVIRGSQVGVILDSIIATSLTNGISDAHKFKSRSQVHAAQEFNWFNSLGQVRICPVRYSHPQVVITVNWRVIVGMAVLLLLTYVYLLRQVTD